MANGVPNPLIRYVIALKDPKVLSLRYVNVPEKIKDLMLITYLFSTYLWYFSPNPKIQLAQILQFGRFMLIVYCLLFIRSFTSLNE